ncbi:hypothetical protein QBC32DRAFT_407117 [Pseudoneurospora amorphoporcata]|uniref:Uncharacterized protein n=1 Tax=Pseudoneurospora amorphoporcata TaxID=241081 RepID=A0AAN6NUR0_9PEZI|nr:hypothetical protein QBC32DRAFT_407117 [Pseudoneurospora amorphoporcata]
MRGQLLAGLTAVLGLLLPRPVVGSEFRALTHHPIPVPGYLGPVAIGNHTLRAPLDPDGSDPFLGSRFLLANHTVIPEHCTTHCETTTDYAKEHPVADGSYASCNFVIAYLVSNNGAFEGIQCALYTHEYALPSFTPDDGNTVGYAYVRDPSLGTTPTGSPTLHAPTLRSSTSNTASVTQTTAITSASGSTTSATSSTSGKWSTSGTSSSTRTPTSASTSNTSTSTSSTSSKGRGSVTKSTTSCSKSSTSVSTQTPSVVTSTSTTSTVTKTAPVATTTTLPCPFSSTTTATTFSTTIRGVTSASTTPVTSSRTSCSTKRVPTTTHNEYSYFDNHTFMDYQYSPYHKENLVYYKEYSKINSYSFRYN